MESPDLHPQGVQIQDKVVELVQLIKDQVRSEVSDFRLELTRGDITVDLYMNPTEKKVQVSVRQIMSTGKKGFFVDLDLTQTPTIRPGQELTRLVPENDWNVGR